MTRQIEKKRAQEKDADDEEKLTHNFLCDAQEVSTDEFDYIVSFF